MTRRKSAVLSFSVIRFTADDAGLFHAPRHRLGKLPQDRAQPVQLGGILVEGGFR